MLGVGPEEPDAASDESNADWLPITGADAALLPEPSIDAWATPPSEKMKAQNASASLVLISWRPLPRVEPRAPERHVSAGDFLRLDAGFGLVANRGVDEVEDTELGEPRDLGKGADRIAEAGRQLGQRLAAVERRDRLVLELREPDRLLAEDARFELLAPAVAGRRARHRVEPPRKHREQRTEGVPSRADGRQRTRAPALGERILAERV